MSNFRKSYYASLGVKPVEVKLSVENALSDALLDLDRLSKLLLWVRIPHVYRPLVWKVILGVFPTVKSAWEYASICHDKTLNALRGSLAAMEFSLEWKECDLTPDLVVRLAYIHVKNMVPLKFHLSIAESCVDIFYVLADGFWLYTAFIKLYRVPSTYDDPSFQSKMTEHVTIMWKLLQSHNESLYSFISNLDVPMDSCCRVWFECFFSNVFTPQALEGVWDILFGGAPGILPYVGLSLLLACRRKIESAKTSQEFLYIIQNV